MRGLLLHFLEELQNRHSLIELQNRHYLVELQNRHSPQVIPLIQYLAVSLMSLLQYLDLHYLVVIADCSFQWLSLLDLLLHRLYQYERFIIDCQIHYKMGSLIEYLDFHYLRYLDFQYKWLNYCFDYPLHPKM